MRAILLNQPGGTENFQWGETSTPAISPDEVLVKQKATSVNPVEAKARSSQEKLDYFFKGERPAVLGWDVAGVVTEVGAAVKDFKKGDEVFGMVNFPGKGKTYAEYVAVPAAHIALKPNNISDEEAATASLAALTAWQILVNTAHVKAGDKVLIHAASGGVGHYLVQIARHLKAYVIGTSSAKNKDFVMSLGANEHIDYKTQKFEDLVKDADIVVDVAGGNAERSVAVTRQGGTIICVPDKLSDDEIEKIRRRGVNVKNFMVTSSGEDMQQVAKLLGSGAIRSHISRSFPLADMAAAHKEIEQGGTKGKIAIRILNYIIIHLFALATILTSGKALAQPGHNEHQLLTDKVGKWSVVITLQPDPGSSAQIVKGITAERTMIGDYCLHEIMHPDPGVQTPDFKRLADLAWNLNEQRWDYMSIDTRITAGIMFFTYKGAEGDSITSFITGFPNPGFGPDKKGRGQTLYARNVILKISKDHDIVKQYWRLIDQPEWLAVQYDYTRQ